LLSLRYVQSLTQETAAAQLGITPRHLRREQREAVHILAQRLWGRRQPPSDARMEDAAPDEAPSPGRPSEDGQPDEYVSQVRQEIASLQHSSPVVLTDVTSMVAGVLDLSQDLAARHGVLLEMGACVPEVVACVRCSALRQALISAIGILVERMSSGRITVCVETLDECAVIVLAGCPVRRKSVPNPSLIREILSAEGGSADMEERGDMLEFRLEFPVRDEIVVMVIDDNEDLVHFFQRYTVNTRYQIVHADLGQDILQMIGQTAPDIVVLDVMLPGIDGWELLIHLRQRPETRGIPVVLCSIVREEELALSLGAAVYLPKPVRRASFIEALDQALAAGGAAARIASASNSEAR
ncbi:MAG: response regulator, partial [Chloroflexi bacterium]|nr:response regulator [Chloroflexota bacterium]